MSKTHWLKSDNSPFLSSWNIDGKVAATIKSAGWERHNLGRGDEELRVLHFTEKDIEPGLPFKPMVCNKTNAKTLVQMSGSKYMEDWAGLTVWISTHKVRLKGESVDGLKLDPRKPSPICSEKQMEEITAECKAVGRTTEQLCGYLGIAAIHKMTEDDYKRAKDALAAFKVSK